VHCPRDDNALQTTTGGEAAVASCPECSGMFLESGQLDRIAEPHAGDLEFSTLDRDSLQHDDRFGPTACPRDGAPMSKVEFNIHTGIILDHCGECGGFWLDGRELDRINQEVRELNEAAAQETAEPAMLWFAKFIWSLPR